jgi:hypothetical protein
MFRFLQRHLGTRAAVFLTALAYALLLLLIVAKWRFGDDAFRYLYL